ncbi:hypothetical protein OC65_13525 [Salmonella enterica]|nr:hypothetical protein [Salmonella enterica]
MKATILKPGKAAGAPVVDMLNFLRGGVVGGHVFASAGEHDRDATGLKKFDVSSPERYDSHIWLQPEP